MASLLEIFNRMEEAKKSFPFYSMSNSFGNKYDICGLEIPLLTQNNIKNGSCSNNSIVKFLGIIRDILEPQYYSLENGNDDSVGSLKESYSQRIPLICSEIPGESFWVHHKKTNNSDVQLESTRSGLKRQADGNMDIESVMGSESNKKRQHKKVYDNAAMLPSKDNPMNACNLTPVIMLYLSDPPEMKVNEVYEFIGIFQDIKLIGVEYEDNLSSDAESSKISTFSPIVHCYRINLWNNIDYMVPKSQSIDFTSDSTTSLSKMLWLEQHFASNNEQHSIASIREKIVSFFSTYLCGDRVSAEYLLLCLLSKVHNRVQSIVPVGNICLNLSIGVSEEMFLKEIPRKLKSMLENILPATQSMKLTIDELNASRLSPYKDYKSEKMISSIIQLADQSVLLLDETHLSEGMLQNSGINNIKILNQYTESQQLSYDFQFYSIDFPIDVRVISISKSKSIISGMVLVPLKPNMDQTIDVDESEKIEELIESFRMYFIALKDICFKMDNDISFVEKSFVEKRKENKDLSSEDLHRWLSLVRVLSLSYGEITLKKEFWQKVLALEKERYERIHKVSR